MRTRTVVLVIASCLAAACGSETSPGGGGSGTGGGTTSTTDSTTTTTTDSSTSTDTTTTTSTTTTVVCQDEPDFQSCYACLTQQDPDGYAAFTNALFGACGCAGGPCAAACDTAEPTTNVCGPPVDASKAGPDCTACIAGLTPGEPCFGDSQASCALEPVCAGFTSAVQRCPP